MALLIIAISSIFIHPYGNIKSVTAQKPLFQGAEMELPVFDTLRASCRNCHSDETVWPWYSYVAPFEWRVEKGVHDARSDFNMSHWSEYTPQHQSEILGRICQMIQNQKMLLHSHMFMHPEAKLNAQEMRLIDEWGNKERDRIINYMDNEKQTLPIELSQ
jgi:hypothetical protein